MTGNGAGSGRRIGGRVAARLAAACALLLSAAGCPRARSSPAPRPGRWASLVGGERTARWLVVRGRTSRQNGAMVLNRTAKQTTTVLAREVNFRDGEVEVDVVRPGGARPGGDGPYTIALRLAPRLLDWSAVYFVCRPGQVEVCRGTSAMRFPSPERIVPLPRARRRERWRFVLAGPRVECYRMGRKLLTYTDAAPRSGTIAITADGCRLDVHRVRYRAE